MQISKSRRGERTVKCYGVNQLLNAGNKSVRQLASNFISP